MVVWTREVAVGDEKWSDDRYILSDYFLLNVDTHDQIFFQKACIN